ncbi:MAG: NAD(P)-dependent oxidoreductase [Chloroflexota bacterium]|nr:MAG: NAD(P)-dependent oxidoreductase [Chloroflexota bacterium]
MRVLVTGATGFIGRRLVSQLLAANVDIVGLAFDEGAENQLAYATDSGANQDVDIIQVDLRQPDATSRAVAFVSPDKVVHLAAAGVADPEIEPELALNHNVQGTLNLLYACFHNMELETPPSQFITIRTPGESKPFNAYVASKAAAWSFCQMFARRYGWPILGAMIFQAYGPGQPSHTFVQAALRSALAGQDFAMTSGTQGRDWIFLSDVVYGLVAALGTKLPPGESVELGTGQRTSLLDVAKLAYELAGRGGQPLAGALPDRTGEDIDVVANVTRTNEMLVWRPQVGLKQGLSLLLDDLRVKDQKKTAGRCRLS